MAWARLSIFGGFIHSKGLSSKFIIISSTSTVTSGSQTNVYSWTKLKHDSSQHDATFTWDSKHLKYDPSRPTNEILPERTVPNATNAINAESIVHVHAVAIDVVVVAAAVLDAADAAIAAADVVADAAVAAADVAIAVAADVAIVAVAVTDSWANIK